MRVTRAWSAAECVFVSVSGGLEPWQTSSKWWSTARSQTSQLSRYHRETHDFRPALTVMSLFLTVPNVGDHLRLAGQDFRQVRLSHFVPRLYPDRSLGTRLLYTCTCQIS